MKSLAEKSRSPVVRALLMLAGLSLIVFGIYLAWQARHRSVSWQTTTGTVIGVLERDGSVYAEVEFSTAGGEIVLFSARQESEAAPPQAGSQVEILYNPVYPQQAMISSMAGLWLLPSLLIAGGLLLLFVGLLRRGT